MLLTFLLEGVVGGGKRRGVRKFLVIQFVNIFDICYGYCKLSLSLSLAFFFYEVLFVHFIARTWLQHHSCLNVKNPPAGPRAADSSPLCKRHLLFSVSVRRPVGPTLRTPCPTLPRIVCQACIEALYNTVFGSTRPLLRSPA